MTSDFHRLHSVAVELVDPQQRHPIASQMVARIISGRGDRLVVIWATLIFSDRKIAKAILQAVWTVFEVVKTHRCSITKSGRCAQGLLVVIERGLARPP
jgi:hypothetical protein